MQLIRGLHNIHNDHRGCVTTIGNFDGLHLGHQAVLGKLTQIAQTMNLPSTVILFEPQPLEYLQQDQAPARLTRLRDKLDILKSLSIDRVLLLSFNNKLAAMGADTFISSLLFEGLAIKYLLVGDDFRFGRARTGDIQMLRESGKVYGFEVDHVDTIRIGDQRISSTRIRQALQAHDLHGANSLLGRKYSICGRVVHGDKRGAKIGYPTLNIDMGRLVSPLRGVFAVRVKGLEEGVLDGVANIGNRPTIPTDNRYVLEVHLFNFNRDIYGSHLEVEFIAALRDEMKFDSLDQLRMQIDSDVTRAKEILAGKENTSE